MNGTSVITNRSSCYSPFIISPAMWDIMTSRKSDRQITISSKALTIIFNLEKGNISTSVLETAVPVLMI
jgi:hypothetical protein